MSVSVNEIVDISVELTNPLTIDTDFSTGLIIGNSTHLTATNRVKVYTADSWETQMTTDGFLNSDPEYKAAGIYFSQNPQPQKVCIGVKLTDDTDDVTALTACRAFSQDWFGVSFCYDVTDSIAEIAAAVEAFSIPAVFFYQTNDAKCLVASQTNILATLQEKNYNMSVGFYSTQNNFIISVLGLFSGLNKTDANSAYTLCFKSVVGFTTENIDDAQMDALKGYNGNVYASFSKRYSFIYPGIAASGIHVDEIYFVELAKYLIQENTISGLVSQLKIPQTESGLNDIVTYISEACSKLLSIGYIGSGIWMGKNILTLTTGTALPNGYIVLADSLASQSSSDRQKRVTPPIYVALKASGAIEHVVIRVFVNR